jgi:photosystem II stability/assembly factor-like uncharacterized protein
MKQGLRSTAGPAHRAGKALRPISRLAPARLVFSLMIITSIALFPGTGIRAETDASIPARLAPRALLLDAVSVGDRICAVGERGHVLFSSDSGQSWQQVQVPTRSTLTGVTFHDHLLGWAVGHDGVILRTRDGGKNWEKVHYTPDDDRPLLDVWFHDASRGFAIGAYGLCLRTGDGGTSWSPVQISEDDWHLHQMARSADGRLYIAAEAGQIYRSDDDGATWMTLPSPYDGSFFGVMPLKKDALMVFGLRGHVFRSDDAGALWRQIPTGTVATLADGIRLADGRILLAGLAGTVLVGDEQATAFGPIPGPGRLGIWAVIETGQPGLVCFGERGATPLALKK